MKQFRAKIFEPNLIINVNSFNTAIFTPSQAPSTPVPGFKEEPKSPGDPTKFYPQTPSQMQQTPTPGTLTTPNDPNKPPQNGVMNPDTYPNTGFIFTTFPQGMISIILRS